MDNQQASLSGMKAKELQRALAKYEEKMSCGHEKRYIYGRTPESSSLHCAICDIESLRGQGAETREEPERIVHDWCFEHGRLGAESDKKLARFGYEELITLVAWVLRPGPYGPLAPSSSEARNAALEALQAVADGYTDCKCDHSDQDCCDAVEGYCPRCTVAAVIRSLQRPEEKL